MKAATCVFTLFIAGLILVACTPALPTFEAVRDETREAMQEIIDLLPPEIDVNDASTETPFNCSGAGAMYTGLWRAYGDETFDPDAFVDSLPEGLDKDWSLDEDALELGLPREHLRHNGTLVTVAVLEDGPGIGILAISRCGQVPDKPN